MTSELERRRPLLERNSAASRGSVGEGVAASLQVALQRPLGGLADRQQPLLGALAEHAQLLGFEVEGVAVEVDDLLAAQPAGVGQLEHRPVAQLQRGAGRDPLQQGPHLLTGQHPRQLLLPLRTRDQIGRVLPDPLGADEEVEEAADRGELARDRRRGGAAGGEPGAVAPHVTVAHLARLQPPPLAHSTN